MINKKRNLEFKKASKGIWEGLWGEKGSEK